MASSKSLGRLTVDLLLQTAGFEEGFNKAERTADAATRRIEQQAKARAKAIEDAFGGMARGIMAPLAAMVSVNAFAGLVKGSIDAQDHLNDLTKSTTLSVTTLAGLGSAAKKSGSDLDSVAAAVSKLMVNIGKDPDKFKKIGISAKDPIEALKQLADVFNAIQNPEERAAFGAAALGKTWAETAPLLAEGGKSIGEMVEKGSKLAHVTKESAEAADKLNDQLEDLHTTVEGVSNQFSAQLVPSLTDTSKAMLDLNEKGEPLLALLRGFAGLGKLPFDLVFGTVDTSTTGYIKDLQNTLKDLEAKREQYNPFSLWGDSLEEIDKKIAITRNQLEAATKFKDKLDKPVGDTSTGTVKTPNVRQFLDDPKKAEITEGQRLIEQLQARLITTEKLTQAEALETEIANGKYPKITAGELDIAKALADQIDMHDSLKQQLDDELAVTREQASAIDREKSALQSLVAATPRGQETDRLQKEALAESAFMSGQIDQTTYDQIIKNLHDVKDEGEDTFKSLKEAIDGFGKQSADAFTDFAFGAKGSFADLTVSILKDLTKMLAYETTFKPLASFVGGWASGLLGGLFGTASGTGGAFALGGVPDADISAYSGTIVSKPTFFAKGGNVMGEAGDEGIFPLKRGADGKLGVQASGVTGGVSIGITINDNRETSKTSTGDSKGAYTAFADRVKGMVVDEMVRQKMPGGLLYNA